MLKQSAIAVLFAACCVSVEPDPPLEPPCFFEPIELDVSHRSLRVPSCGALTPPGLTCRDAELLRGPSCVEPELGAGPQCVAGLPCHPVTVWLPPDWICPLEYSDLPCP